MIYICKHVEFEYITMTSLAIIILRHKPLSMAKTERTHGILLKFERFDIWRSW